MVDTNVMFRNWLLGCPGLVGLLDREGTRSVYVGGLPEGVDVNQGPAITFFTRGGVAHSEMPLVAPSLQVRVWAAKDQGALARKVYLVVHEWIHGKNMVKMDELGTILSCLCSVFGQDVTDPDTDWATVVSFYELQCVPQ